MDSGYSSFALIHFRWLAPFPIIILIRRNENEKLFRLEITADSFTNLIKATLRDTPRSDVDLVSTGDSTQPAQADEDHARGTPRAFAKALTLESLREKYVTQAFSSVLLFGGLAYFVLLPALVQGVGPNFFENIGFRKPAQKFREEYSKALLSWFSFLYNYFSL